MNFKKWVKSLQTAGYNDARTTPILIFKLKSVWNKPKQTTNFVEKKIKFRWFCIRENMWWICYRSEVEQRGRNIHLRELLHPEEDSITSRDELFNNFDGGDVLENRMFWLSGDIYLKFSQTMCINRLCFFEVKKTVSPFYINTIFI